MELKIEELNKTYPGGTQALKNVTLNIKNGLFGLLGPNGAGKSTLMRTIATLQNADSGSIWLDNVNVLEQKDEVRKWLGYLPQEFGPDPLRIPPPSRWLPPDQPASAGRASSSCLRKEQRMCVERSARSDRDRCAHVRVRRLPALRANARRSKAGHRHPSEGRAPRVP